MGNLALIENYSMRLGKELVDSLSKDQYLDLESDLSGEEIKVGNMFISDEGELIRITEIILNERAERDYQQTMDFYTQQGINLDDIQNKIQQDDSKWVFTRKFQVKFEWFRDDSSLPVASHIEDVDNGGTLYWNPMDGEKLKKHFTFLRKTLKQYREELERAKKGEITYEVQQENTQGLISAKADKGILKTMAKDVAAKAKHVELIRSVMQRDLTLMKRTMMDKLEAQKRELSVLRESLMLTVAEFEKQIKRIYKVIDVIELYLGVHEQVVQIQEGPNAPKGSPIEILQRMLFIDEEVGDPRVIRENVRGIHAGCLEDFDSWVCGERSDGVGGRNYERMLPHACGVVAMQVSRKQRIYSEENIWYNSMRNAEDRKTYILVRNGGNIYRIITNQNFAPRMYPKRGELEMLMESVIARVQRYYKGDQGKIDEAIEENYQPVVENYFRKGLMLQGLVDRTQIFDIPEGFKFAEAESWPNVIHYLHDDELALPDGRESYWDWHKHINSKIGVGSRIVLIGHKMKGDLASRLDDRFSSDKYKHYGLPNAPETGVYELKSRWRERETELSSRKVKYSQFEITFSKEVMYDQEYNKKLNSIFFTEAEILADFEAKREALLKDPNIRKVELKKGYRLSDYYKAPDGTIYHVRWSGEVLKLEARLEVKLEKMEGSEYSISYEQREYFIHYNPKDDVYKGWFGSDGSDERKVSLSYVIYPQEDKFILNYDQIDLADVEFYINSRNEREHYLDMMEELWTLRYNIKRELKEEAEFVKFAVINPLSNGIEGDQAGMRMLGIKASEAVNWWKYKTQTKRRLTSDVNKAVRMIHDRIKTEWLDRYLQSKNWKRAD